MTEEFIPRIVVMTTYNRPDVALNALRTLDGGPLDQRPDTLFVVDNGTLRPMPDGEAESTWPPYYTIRDDTQPVNLSALWNQGIFAAAASVRDWDKWDVAIVNDDCVFPPNWLADLSKAMRATTAVAACTGEYDRLHTEPGPVNLHTRMTGWAFLLRGEAGLLADESLKWWFGDDDLDWQARKAGGMLMVRGAQPHNLYPNGLMTPERQAQSGLDAATFKKKWGMLPW